MREKKIGGEIALQFRMNSKAAAVHNEVNFYLYSGEVLATAQQRSVITAAVY